MVRDVSAASRRQAAADFSLKAWHLAERPHVHRASPHFELTRDASAARILPSTKIWPWSYSVPDPGWHPEPD